MFQLFSIFVHGVKHCARAGRVGRPHNARGGGQVLQQRAVHVARTSSTLCHRVILSFQEPELPGAIGTSAGARVYKKQVHHIPVRFARPQAAGWSTNTKQWAVHRASHPTAHLFVTLNSIARRINADAGGITPRGMRCIAITTKPSSSCIR